MKNEITSKEFREFKKNVNRTSAYHVAGLTGRSEDMINNYISGRAEVPYAVYHATRRLKYYLTKAKEYIAGHTGQYLQSHTSRLPAHDVAKLYNRGCMTKHTLADITGGQDKDIHSYAGGAPMPITVEYALRWIEACYNLIRRDVTATTARKLKKIINGKTYNTQTATMLAMSDNGLIGADMEAEELYRTPRGDYFRAGNDGRGGAWIIPADAGDVIRYMRAHAQKDEYYAVFGEAKFPFISGGEMTNPWQYITDYDNIVFDWQRRAKGHPKAKNELANED